jgi:hypothetical protein
MNPLSDILQPEKSSFSISSPAVDYRKFSMSSITPSSPSKFLLKFRAFNLPQLIMEMRDLTPTLVISFEDRFRFFRFCIVLSVKLNILSTSINPLSPMLLPRRLMSSSSEFTAPSKKVSAPSASS